MRIGILGGTFDPVHIAHLIIAEEARVKLALEAVVFIPAGRPWLKADQPISPAPLRLEMARLAVAPNPNFRISSIEVDRPGLTYTIDTVEVLRKEWGTEAEIHFILGMDAVRDLHRWKEPEHLLKLCGLAVFGRPDYQDVPLAELEEIAPGASSRIQFLRDPQIGVSGSEIRRRVEQGISIRYLVPRSVERFIQDNRLYRREEADG